MFIAQGRILHLFGVPGWSFKTHLHKELWKRCIQSQEKYLVRNVSIQQILTAPTGTAAFSIIAYKCYEVLGFELRSCGDIMNL